MELRDATVLVVDDEPFLRDIFGEWLQLEGCRVLTAENGAAALRILSAGQVDVIVTDIRMPVMDGIALVKELNAREREAGQYLPKVIFITGFADIEVRDAYDLGVETMLQKPIDRADFIAAVRRRLRRPEEIWSESPAQAGVPLQMMLPPVPAAIDQGLIEFGHGGFCLRAPVPVRPGPVRFELSFESEPTKLAGHGEVRWVEPTEHQVGIEILHIDHECLGWAIRLIAAHARLSYIPRTCRQPGGAKAGSV
jgi:CheY-like chemotaxis protein